MQRAKEQLKAYFDRYIDLSQEELDMFFQSLKHKEFDKKEFLLKKDTICRHKYFIVEGLVRFYETDDNGNEIINQFGIENWWITNLDSFVNQASSLQYIQALEKTKVLCIEKSELEKLYTTIPKLERAFRIITENMLIAIQRKDEVYMKKNSKERYYSLVEQIPDFTQRVPQYMIASYLNITPEYLSEIKKPATG